MTKQIKFTGGFTLIEVLVSVSIFSIVMLVSTGAVFSIVEANKKAHTLKSVITNLNFTLESMVRDVRVGSQFSCGAGGDCPAGGSIFSYRANRNLIGGSQNDFIRYSLMTDSEGIKRIQKEITGDGTPSVTQITAREINITSLKFYVIGTQPSLADTKQPKVVITIRGYAGAGNTKSDFNIQTTISQRSID